MKLSVGPLDQVPTDRCVPVADGAAVVLRVGDEVVALANRCLHKGLPLAGGRVRDEVLTCPQHFWQYDVAEGRHLGGRGLLTAYEVEITEQGEVFVDVPLPQPQLSMRERLLAHAREWERGA